MNNSEWNKKELNFLKKLYETKNPWETDAAFARRVTDRVGRTSHAIRFKIRELFPVEIAKVRSPQILLLDIETLPAEARVWGVWKQNINPANIKKEWSILSWGAKWLFDNEVHGEIVSPEEAINRQDYSILGGMWKMMEKADIVITQNGDEFDLKKLNTRFLVHRMMPPSFYKSVDTLKVLKTNFDFTWNRMDYVNKILGIERKIPTSGTWWDRCSDGDPKTLKQMLVYNKQDVHILEELYLTLRPWIKNHPNLNLFTGSDTPACRNCGSLDLEWSGKYQTDLGLYQGCRCQGCGAIGRSTRKQFKLASSIVGG